MKNLEVSTNLIEAEISSITAKPEQPRLANIVNASEDLSQGGCLRREWSSSLDLNISNVFDRLADAISQNLVDFKKESVVINQEVSEVFPRIVILHAK